MPSAGRAKTEVLDLGGNTGGHPERLDRAQWKGELAEAEHLGRYRWIAAAAEGKRVLDAGCGTAYGTAMLAGSGATEVSGVDRAADVLDGVRSRMPPGVKLEAGDLHDLPFDDASFDLVVCFEVLEHLEDPEAGLDELARVLAPGGLLAVSSPNRNVYPPGNPHHVREYLPGELAASLARRFANVRLMRQHAWMSTAILDDDGLRAGDDAPLEDLTVRKTAAIEPGQEIFTVGLASESDVPQLPGVAVLSREIDQRGPGEPDQSERDQLRAALIAAEQQLANLPELQAHAAELAELKDSAIWRYSAPWRRARAWSKRSALPRARRRLKNLMSGLLSRGS